MGVGIFRNSVKGRRVNYATTNCRAPDDNDADEDDDLLAGRRSPIEREPSLWIDNLANSRSAGGSNDGEELTDDFEVEREEEEDCVMTVAVLVSP